MVADNQFIQEQKREIYSRRLPLPMLKVDRISDGNNPVYGP